MLSRDQKIEFKRNGFLVLDDVLDQKLVEAMQKTYERDELPETQEELKAVLDDPSAASIDFEDRNAKQYYDTTLDIRPSTTDLFRAVDKQIRQYAAELAGPVLTNVHPLTRIVHMVPRSESLTSPEAAQPSHLDEEVHVDGLKEADELGPFPIIAAIYVDRVQPRGGGFTVWPGSHWILADFLEDHDPDEATDGVPVPTEDGWEYDARVRDRYDPFEIAGDAGTVTLMHGHLVHSGGVNLEPGAPRKEIISRFCFPEEIREKRPLDDPFWGWDIEDLPPDLSRT